MVFHSGFVNRLADFSPVIMNQRANHSYMSGSGMPSLAKGWKPFKLVLKGSKLYFYKPPSDRNNAVRDLFPTDLVVVFEEEGVGKDVFEGIPPDAELDETSRGGKGKEKDDGRRKRAYWGRGTHPNLTVGEGIEKGTFEALVHESILATTFLQSNVAPDSGRYRPEWKDFASTVLLTIPSAAGRARFETEFFRCSSLLLDSSLDEHQQEEIDKVRWLTEQYLTFYDSPADEEAWQTWWSKTLPDVPYVSKSLADSAVSPSMQVLHTSSPDPAASPSKKGQEFSPNLGTFSPRPEANNGRMLSLLDALNDSREGGTKSSKQQGSSLRNTLQRAGLTRDVLVGLDPQLVARSLFLFNQRALHEYVPVHITADLCFEQVSREASSTGNVQEAPTAQPPPSSPLRLFTGSEEQPHWLTKAILLQILISDSPGRPMTSGSMSTSRFSDDRAAVSSRTHSRSEVISAWARIGELCRRTGDECSWRAIFAALCSRPIARLDKVWKRVDGDAVRAVQSWIYGHDGSPPALIPETKSIPWAAEGIAAIKEAMEESHVVESNVWKVCSLIRAKQIFERLRGDFESTRKVPQSTTAESDDVEALAAHCEYLAEGGSINGLGAKFTR